MSKPLRMGGWGGRERVWSEGDVAVARRYVVAILVRSRGFAGVLGGRKTVRDGQGALTHRWGSLDTVGSGRAMHLLIFPSVTRRQGITTLGGSLVRRWLP